MKRWTWKLAARVVVFGLPYALLMLFGCFWLYEHQYLLIFACVVVLASVFGWLLIGWLASKPTRLPDAPPPANNWASAGERAWEHVNQLAARAESHPPSWSDANAWLALFREVFDVVAGEFHPTSSRPALEITAVESLRVAELVARDLRTFLEQQVPGSDWITLHNINTAVQWGPLSNQLASGLYNVYRLARFAFNPPSALVNEAQSVLVGSSTTNLIADLPRMAAGYCVRRAGYYAIQLYSGQITLADPELAELGADKPLRVVVLGQTKAGKSSLINALFGQVRAATDVLPCTEEITPYVLAREGLPDALVFDTVGFAGEGDQAARKRLDNELARCDLVLVVCSANTAAREPDKRLLDEARLRFADQLKRAAPPIAVVLSHVDTLRPFNEWSAPYDFIGGDSAKERNVRDAVDAVAADLQVPRDSIVPVCLRKDAVYNVEESLLPLIARILPEGQRAKLLRILLEVRTADQREALKRQLANVGLSAARLVLGGK
jgi:uncharacterized protein